jgi:prefoldin subunit 5
MDLPFHNTVMGRRFIEGTIPQLVDNIGLLNSRLTALTQHMATMQESIDRISAAVERIEDAQPFKNDEMAEVSER